MTREEFAVKYDVVKSKRSAFRITGRAWPFGHGAEEGQRQSGVWGREFGHHNGFDHVEVWSRDGVVQAVTSHVYDDDGGSVLVAAKAFGEKYGLNVFVPSDDGLLGDGVSWHSPSATLIIFLRDWRRQGEAMPDGPFGLLAEVP